MFFFMFQQMINIIRINVINNENIHDIQEYFNIAKKWKFEEESELNIF